MSTDDMMERLNDRGASGDDESSARPACCALPPPPGLGKLKSRECSLPELQAALVKLIELHNEQGKMLARALQQKADREWQADF